MCMNLLKACPHPKCAMAELTPSQPLAPWKQQTPPALSTVLVLLSPDLVSCLLLASSAGTAPWLLKAKPDLCGGQDH